MQPGMQKTYSKSGSLGRIPIANYVVAYGGAAKMETVFGWIADSYKKLNLSDPEFGSGDRRFMPSAALDGVYLLGVGACIFENNVGFLNAEKYQMYPKARCSVLDCERGALLMLFGGLLGLVQGREFESPQPHQISPE